VKKRERSKMRKRKAAFEEEATFQKLEGQIKKIRITHSPGELRY
jgi:hypothetical protein